MEELVLKSNKKTTKTSLKHKRYLNNFIDWNERLIAIKGARGTGKTTLMLQHLKENLKEKALYVSLDDIYFTENKLTKLAEDFVNQGGKHLLIDEVHKYPNWSLELKNIYDDFDELQVIFTSSSVLQVHKGEADLSRRAVNYVLHGLSFREFLALEANYHIEPVELNDLIKNHKKISEKISNEIKPLKHFADYLQYGYYPYFNEGKQNYHQKLSSTVNLILEVDLPAVLNIDYTSVYKLKKLLYILATSVPIKPNITRLSEKINTNRNTALQYLNHLQEAHLIQLLKSKTKGMSLLAKPEKVYLGNGNLMYSIAPENANKGTLRETFFMNQLLPFHDVNFTPKGDFLVDNNLVFEVGGKNKDTKQLKEVKNGLYAIDDIEVGYRKMIPLWMFGLLY